MRVVTLGTLAGFALLVGCSNTADGVRQDAGQAADATNAAVETAGTRVEGAVNTGQVKSALIADSRLRSGNIDVDTNEERKTVTLNGTVPTQEEKAIAGEVATAKAEGYTIVNNLTVQP